MKTDLSGWKRNWSLLGAFFSAGEAAELQRRLAGFQPRHVFYCSFESRFARSGGLAAVAMNTLPFLKEVGGIESASLLSPFYTNLMDRAKLAETGIAFEVPFADRLVRAQLLRLDVPYSQPRSGAVSEYYIEADGFFGAANALKDPYLYVANDPWGNEAALQSNSLFFCRAVPSALAALGITQDAVLHLQEWQTALLSLTAKDAMLTGVLGSCATVQTLHNPYDTFVAKTDLKKIVTGADRRGRIELLPADGLTAFQIGLQLVDAPVVTVSENFAHELTEDLLQTGHFAPHLQSIFHDHPVVGINNGPFIGFSDLFPKRDSHTIAEIAGIKQRVRSALLKILDEYRPPQRFGELTYRGGSILGLPDDVPILAMSGRLDPVQKGYDILLQALERFEVDEIKAVLTPMAVRASDLDFFHEVAARCRGNLTVFPMRMEKGYAELQAGSTFGVMPSIYEPFGAAIEYMANGTVNIARKTGGLVDQVADGENGFLFRERPDACNLARIRDFAEAAALVQLRRTNRWAVEMVDALEIAIEDAGTLYRERRDDYCAMIQRGFAKAATFSWEANAADYAKIYGRIAGG